MRLEGRAYRMGDDIDTDVIIPGRYLRTTDSGQWARHVFEPLGIDPAHLNRRIVVAGKNFGCGSSREQAALGIKAAGVTCVVAESFARIFFRNAINVGLPAVECPDADTMEDGDEIMVDLTAGRIEDLTTGVVYGIIPYPDFLMDILGDGGLLEHYRRTGRG